jgi:peptide chain release factor 1
VAVLPEPEDVEIDLKPDDYEVERYAASSGPGGQHVNKTASAVRMTHKATGLVVKCFEERSLHKNLSKALRIMKSKLYDFYQQQEAQQRADTRKSLVGSGDRSQRIRTYNFPDNRVTDHRINLTLYKLDQIIAGNLQPVTEALIEHERQTLRSSMGSLD